MTSRNRVELAVVISNIHTWATLEDRDTISGLSDKQSKEAVAHLKKFWEIVERRRSR